MFIAPRHAEDNGHIFDAVLI